MPTLPELRISRAISQKDLANKTGIATSTISRLENGIQKPNFRTIQKLAGGLGVEPAEVEFIGSGRLIMQYDDTIVCIKNRRYMVAANLMVKEYLGAEVHKLSQYHRNRLTRKIAQKLKSNHLSLREFRGGSLKPIEIAEEAYEKTCEELETEGVIESRTINIRDFISKVKQDIGKNE
jgi:transcriptional regulator with XRE-family HTH domain